MERRLSLLDAYTQIPKRIGVMSMTGEEPRRNELLLGEDTDGFSIYR